ncbi:energy transducer TonB [Rhizobium lusitanum]|uniref:Protein TonB n=1 Tax=Rhizobium lusitanum TaxID=293958 RepID=A0A7X0IN89_9HYPH|nr:energy transducer TonB [Rhizobium lusitanum]MBB6484114.1 protein TonB [Rhizobium lusitanum]
MAMRSVKVSMERRSDGGLNDNYPSALPGHELTGLEGVPRPPAGETVIHYSCFTQISSFPEHPTEPTQIEAADPLPMDALPEKPHAAASGRKVPLFFPGLGSCLFHGIVVALLLLTFVATPEEAKEEAGDTVSVIMIGNSDADQMAAGEENQQPEQMTAEAVQPETVQPTEVTPEEVQPQASQPEAVQTQPAAAQSVQTAEAVQPVEQAPPTTVVPEQPQILVTQTPAETTVIQTAEPIQPVDNQVAEGQPIQPMPEVVTPLAKPKPVERPWVVKKPVPKVAKVKSGSRGESEEDSKRGSINGTEAAQSDQNSQLNARKTGSGDAAIANYQGKLQSRIKRYVQRVSSKYEKGLTLVVRLSIGSDGELRSVSLARSSGNSGLDDAVMEQVRNAAPFSPLPPEWGKPTWSFVQAVQTAGR